MGNSHNYKQLIEFFNTESLNANKILFTGLKTMNKNNGEFIFCTED